MIFNLRKKLEEWATAKIISKEQAQSVLHYEAALKGNSWVLYGVTGIGATAIAVGIISLIAANWMDFSAYFKLAAYFFLHAAAGAVFLKVSDRPGPWRETLLVVFALLFLGGIGLVSQVYNLQSEPWKGAVFFVLLTFPLTQMGNSQTLARGWVIASFFACGSWAIDSLREDPGNLRWSWFTAYPLCLAALSFFLERIGIYNAEFRKAILTIGVGFTLAAGSVAMNFCWLDPTSVGNSFRSVPARLIPELSVALVAFASLARGNQVAFSQRLITASMFLALGFFFFLPLEFDFGDFGKTSRQVVGAVGFLVIWSLAAGAAAQAGYKRLFDFASLIIALRFVVIYFEVFGSLTRTGVGLIFSGAFILAMAGIWAKFRAPLRTLVGGKP